MAGMAKLQFSLIRLMLTVTWVGVALGTFKLAVTSTRSEVVLFSTVALAAMIAFWRHLTHDL